MNNPNTLVNYEAESKRLEEKKDNSNYWNPRQGKFEVVALSEVSIFESIEKDGTLKQKAKIDIEVVGDQKRYVWTMGKGNTPASLYGQLINLAKNHNNKLVGQKFTVVIKHDGTKRDFTIV